MTILTSQGQLADLISGLKNAKIVFLDTEFLRETTYFPQLCVIQVKIPGEDPVAIDALADGLDLDPLWAALQNPGLLKVFHSGRQDLEIIYAACRAVPAPLFDTQIAASVLGYGDQVGFESLVRGVLGHQLDKGSQFTDWSRRPLTGRQLTYALDDVRYLEPVYEKLTAMLMEKDREDWISGDMKALENPGLYETDPNEVWRRIKIKSDKPRDLAMLRALAAWREHEARARNLPRSRVVKDDPLAEMALHPPRSREDLATIRGIDKGLPNGRRAAGILAAVESALALPEADYPRTARKKALNDDQELLLDILKLLTKMRAREIGVSVKMLAGNDDLENLIRGGFDASPLSRGWRFEAFGRDLIENPRFAFSVDLKSGRATLSD